MPDNLVSLREGPGPAIAFVHPASGLATAFGRLVPHLGGRGGVHAFASVEPGDERSTIASIAADYWEQLRPHVTGSLVLAGWSFGGAVALRMASLAEADGHAVRHVVLLDSGTPQLLATRTNSALEQMAGLFELDPGEVAPGAVPAEREQALSLVAARLRVLHADGRIDVADLRPFADVYDWHIRTARRPWQPGPVAAPVVLVRAREETGWGDVPQDLGWSAVLGQAPEVVWTPGTHYSLMSARCAPHLAAVLSPLLAEEAMTGPVRGRLA